LLTEDAQAATAGAATERSSRRLFDRLVAIGGGTRAHRSIRLPPLRTLDMGRRPRPKDLDGPRRARARAALAREVFARVVGPDCNLDLVIDEIRAELRDLVAVAGGWHLRTHKQFADAIRLAMGRPRLQPLSRTENLVLTAVAYFQPITRGELSQLFGKEVSRDLIGQLRALNFIAAGPRSPQPGAPYTYVTTKQFLSHFGFETLRDLPDMEQLEEAGLLSKQKLLTGALPGDLSDKSRIN
jgi:segregation and condensation protein B